MCLNVPFLMKKSKTISQSWMEASMQPWYLAANMCAIMYRATAGMSIIISTIA